MLTRWSVYDQDSSRWQGRPSLTPLFRAVPYPLVDPPLSGNRGRVSVMWSTKKYTLYSLVEIRLKRSANLYPFHRDQ